MKYRMLSGILAVILLCSGCRHVSMPVTSTAELRGVWISYLDLHPLLSDADSAAAAERLDTLFDTCRDAGINTVFFHVRAHSDAYYPSAVFPAAKSIRHLLTADFDPLAYAVNAAHAREIKIHAWINPYRIGDDAAAAVCADIFEQDGVWYYNPAAADAQHAVVAGVREILDHYAVDGIHFDDYFYPSGLSATPASFESVPAHLSVGDWRRAQVNGLISTVHSLTRTYNRIFGISPTALPHTDREKAYADTAMWLATTGFVDYLCPQIYFGFSHESHPFETTLTAWESLPRHDDVALYIGLALYKSGQPDAYAGRGENEWVQHRDIIARQIRTMRQHKKCDGFVLFRYAHLLVAAEEVNHLQQQL